MARIKEYYERKGEDVPKRPKAKKSDVRRPTHPRKKKPIKKKIKTTYRKGKLVLPKAETSLKGTTIDKIIAPTVKGLKKSAAAVKEAVKPGVERARKSAKKRGKAFKKSVSTIHKKIKSWGVQNTQYKEGE